MSLIPSGSSSLRRETYAWTPEGWKVQAEEERKNCGSSLIRFETEDAARAKLDLMDSAGLTKGAFNCIPKVIQDRPVFLLFPWHPGLEQYSKNERRAKGFGANWPVARALTVNWLEALELFRSSGFEVKQSIQIQPLINLSREQYQAYEQLGQTSRIEVLSTLSHVRS